MTENFKEAKETVDDLLNSNSVVLPVSNSGQPIKDQIYIVTPEDYWRKNQGLLWTGLIISSLYFFSMIFLYL